MNPSQVKAFLGEQKCEAEPTHVSAAASAIDEMLKATHHLPHCRRSGALLGFQAEQRRTRHAPEEILALSCVQLSAAIREAGTGAVAAMEAVLDRARQVQPRLNCFLRIDETSARGRASRGPSACARALHGVPMAHKDMYYRRGVSSCGSKILRERPAPATATALERLDAAGAVQFGVLNMTEFALGPTGYQAPGNKAIAATPGMSSASSAASAGTGASVAARATRGLGSDTGGSIRLPAAFCGTSGSSPPTVRASRAGHAASFSLDTVGPLTRTVEDGAHRPAHRRRRSPRRDL